jgi:phosphoesterase RecJ-like protein
MAIMDVPPELIEFLQKYDTYFLLGHKEPDGDCIGSQFALASFLRRRGKTALLFSPGPFLRKEIRRHEEYFQNRIPPELLRKSAGVVVLDCSAMERIGDLSKDIAGREAAVIDHHSAGEEDFGCVRYIDPKAPCVTLLVQKIIEAFGDEPTAEEAHRLFVGFATDTGFFRHLESEAAEALLMVSRLAEKGITPRSIFRETYGSYSLESRIFIADALKTAETFYDGRFILVHELRSHSRRFQDENRQTDTVYQLLLSVEGCEALAFIREEDSGKTSVSMRSTDSVDVGRAARSFGGGGHKNAAGFTSDLSYAEIRPGILQRFAEIFSSPTGEPKR